jgi:uncharacterized protein (TIGR02117 family)
MKILKPIFYTVLSIIIVLVLYVTVAFGLTVWTPDKSTQEKKERTIYKTIYIVYNSLHSDIVINLEESELPLSWKEYLPELLKSKTKGFISFGWGDKETYLNTATWNDLKLSTALKALFINSPSLMHVTYIKNIYRYQKKTIQITKEQQSQLEKNILKSFGKEIKFYQKGYHRNDTFYHSPYQYNIINTCNTWTGKTLYDANISVNPWTPFVQNVISSVR